MPAGRTPAHADLRRVDPILVSIRAEEPNRRLAVLNLRREDGLLAEAILDAGDNIAAR
jgi:hypothetical protein